MDDPMVSSMEGEKNVPNLEMAQALFEYELHHSKGVEDAGLIAKVMTFIKEDSMAEPYRVLCEKYGWSLDEDLLTTLQEENNNHLEKLTTKYDEAVENAGETEVMDAQFAKARYLTQTGQWEAAFDAYDEILGGRKTSIGKKIDATLEKARIALFNVDGKKMKDLIAEAKKLIEKGGDWDRRNRLKVYEALYLITARDPRGAAKLLLECVATFTCVELCSYEKFMFYTIVMAIMTLSRTDMKVKLVKNPQVLSVIREVPHMEPLLNSIYNCEYKSFFQTLVKVYPEIERNRYFGPHAAYMLREYRILAYAQFLEAYKSVRLSSMASSFGIDSTLLDKELSRFIASGRLSAKIDKVGDVVETIRPDKKSSQYQEVIKKGDQLLNSVQKLARVLDV